MFTQIRKLMAEDINPLSGQVEVDETYIGGKKHGKRGRGASGKSVVMGIVERKGNAITKVIPDVDGLLSVGRQREKRTLACHKGQTKDNGNNSQRKD